MTIAEAAAEAGVSVEVIREELATGKRSGYGRRRGLGNLELIPQQYFAEPTTRLPPEKRYATEAELKKATEEFKLLMSGRATEEQVESWWNEGFGHLPPGVVWPDYVEQELNQGYFGYAPQVLDTWIDIDACIIYADGRPSWTDVRVLKPAPETKTKPKARGGKPKYDWDDVREYVTKLFKQSGDFRPWDIGSGWQAQADLEREVSSYLQKHGGGEPSESTVRAWVSKFLRERGL